MDFSDFTWKDWYLVYKAIDTYRHMAYMKTQNDYFNWSTYREWDTKENKEHPELHEFTYRLLEYLVNRSEDAKINKEWFESIEKALKENIKE